MGLSRFRVSLAMAVAVAVIAGPASATHETGAAHTTRAQAVYFHCDGPSKAQTLANPTWDTAPPSQSVQAGAGCGQQSNAATSSVTWTGTFTGNLDSASVELHNMLWVGSARQTGQFTVSYVLAADGEDIASGTAVVEPVTTPSNFGITEEIAFTIAAIGLMPEEGNGTIERDYGLTITASDGHNVWVWDTTEVPAGITFNGPR